MLIEYVSLLVVVRGAADIGSVEKVDVVEVELMAVVEAICEIVEV